MTDTTQRLTWQRAGPFGRRAGEYFIAHVRNLYGDRFVLSLQQQRLGDYGTYDEAKRAAEDHAKGVVDAQP